LAVFGRQLSPGQKAQFALDIEEIPTLHKIDIVWMDDQVDLKLEANVVREGVVVYGTSHY
jgi:hypothetical protein